MEQYANWLIFAAMLLVSPAAYALQLDELLPDGVPGFGSQPYVTVLSRLHPQYDPLEINLGGLALSPTLSSGGGYDSAVNGTSQGSTVLNLVPSLLAEDTQAGFGAYVSAGFTNNPQATAQNSTNTLFALGERVGLAQNTLSVAAAHLRETETGFALTGIDTAHPLILTADEIRVSDIFTTGMITLTPAASWRQSSYNADPAEDATTISQALNLDFSADTISHFVAYLHAEQSDYRLSALNANSFEALAGFADMAAQLWDVRWLAGIACRQPAHGRALNLPVIEGAADWMPDELDSLTLSAAHEIGDPGEIETSSYRLDQADFTFAHEYLRNVIITGEARAVRAAYIGNPLRENLYYLNLAMDWHLSRTLAVKAMYEFNDRQSPNLGAANEHVASLNLVWTP